jgi:predicted nucleotidyltransferase
MSDEQEPDLGIEPTHLAILREILARHLPPDARVIAYGSRAKGTHSPRSDLDLIIKNAPVDRHIMADLSSDIEDSDFPLLCDIQSYEEINNALLRDHIDRVGKVVCEGMAGQNHGDGGRMR